MNSSQFTTADSVRVPSPWLRSSVVVDLRPWQLDVHRHEPKRVPLRLEAGKDAVEHGKSRVLTGGHTQVRGVGS
jgi:hypothetical protein